MKAVIQRVSHAKCSVDGQITGQISGGLLVLLGVGPADTENTAQQLADKLSKLRIFNDENGKMNLSVQDVGGQILSISQFTLFADTTRGNRPSYTDAAPPEQAKKLYQAFNRALGERGLVVAEGRFGAHMQIELCNDGPVTISLEVTAKSK